MKHPKSAARAAIDTARLEQRALIEDAAAMGELPSNSWVERVAELESRIFSLDLVDQDSKPRSRS